MIDGQSVGPVLVDVTPHTLGLEVCDGMSFAGPHLVFSPIIHRNSPLPARGTVRLAAPRRVRGESRKTLRTTELAVARLTRKQVPAGALSAFRRRLGLELYLQGVGRGPPEGLPTASGWAR